MFRISVVGNDANGLRISAVGEVETAQAVVGCRKAEPNFRVARMQFGRVAEILLGEAEIIGAVLFLAKVQGVVRIAADRFLFGGSRNAPAAAAAVPRELVSVAGAAAIGVGALACSPRKDW